MAKDKLVIGIDGDPKKYKESLKDVESSTSGLAENLKTLAKGAAIGFTALAGAATAAVNEARKMETITTQFEVLTGSAAEASKVVKDLQDFSAKTPFQFDGIAKAAQQLLGFGFNADQIPGKLQQIGDVASAVGQPIGDLSLIFGQVSAAGKLTGERLLQFQERAVPIGPALAKTMGVAEESIKDLVSKGEVSFEIFEEAFKSLSDEGGFAFEGMIKQSKTLDGVISTTKDNVALFAASIGKELLPVAKEITTQFLGFVQSLRESDEFLNLIKGTISVTGKIILGTAEAFETLGTRIGAIMATISESIKAALELDFARAAEIFKTNDKAFREELIEIQRGYKEKSENLDKSLYENREENRKEAHAKEIEDIQAQREVKQEIEEAEKEKKQEEFDAKLEEMAETNEILTKAELENMKKKKKAKDEQEKIDRIKELQKKGKHDEAMAQLEELKNDRIIKSNENRLDREQQIQTSLLSAGHSFLQKGATMAKEGSNEQKGIQSVLAAISTFTAVNQALSSPPGPPWTLPLAASIGAMGFANVAKIQGAKFAKGGVFWGGVPGVDSIPASVQQGEIIAPRQSFEEVIGSVRASREAERMGGNGAANVNVMVSYDSPEASQILTVQQNEDRALGTSRAG